MDWTESNETMQDRRQNDLSALLFEVALFVLVILLLTFTAHAQQSAPNNSQVLANQSQTQSAVSGNVTIQSQPAFAIQKMAVKTEPKGGQTTQNAQPKTHVILVSVSHRKLALIEDGKTIRIYTVAVGKKSTPTPGGKFVIVSRVSRPVWSHKGKVVQPGPENPVGTRWMGLSVKGYGIHGTNVPESIGQAASHGCVRMGKKDLEELFALVNVGDQVNIRTDNDSEVAAIFDVQPESQQLQASATTTVVAGGQ